MKKNSTKQIAWFKMPIDLMADERIAELVGRRGVAGFGVYISILCEIYRRPSRCLTETQLRALKFTGATFNTVHAVVNDFGLFRTDRSGHIRSAIDFLGFDNAPKVESASPVNRIANESPSLFNPFAIGFESDGFPTPARTNKDKDQDKDQQHQAAADWILQLPSDDEWALVTMKNSGFVRLLKRNWSQALEVFRQHVVANCKLDSIRSLDDARQYFYRYVTNSITGAQLQKKLEEHERLHPEQNIYCFEDSASQPGSRSYKGIKLPDAAPPRPNDRADWDFETSQWISLDNNELKTIQL